jgi:hypothetical protein
MSSISSPLIEAAEEAVRLAQERLAALRAVPATDEHYPVGTVIRWQRDAGSPRVAIKVPTGQWSVTHRSTAMRWDGLVNTHLSAPLTYFQVATSWDNAMVGEDLRSQILAIIDDPFLSTHAKYLDIVRLVSTGGQ